MYTQQLKHVVSIHAEEKSFFPSWEHSIGKAFPWWFVWAKIFCFVLVETRTDTFKNARVAISVAGAYHTLNFATTAKQRKERRKDLVNLPSIPAYTCNLQIWWKHKRNAWVNAKRTRGWTQKKRMGARKGSRSGNYGETQRESNGNKGTRNSILGLHCHTIKK